MPPKTTTTKPSQDKQDDVLPVATPAELNQAQEAYQTKVDAAYIGLFDLRLTDIEFHPDARPTEPSRKAAVADKIQRAGLRTLECSLGAVLPKTQADRAEELRQAVRAAAGTGKRPMLERGLVRRTCPS